MTCEYTDISGKNTIADGVSTTTHPKAIDKNTNKICDKFGASGAFNRKCLLRRDL